MRFYRRLAASIVSYRPMSLSPPPISMPPLQSSYRAEDILAQYGSLSAFMAAVAPKQPLPIPDLHFTEEENRRMDQLLAAERGSDSL